MVTYRTFITAIAKHPGGRVCDIAAAVGLPDYVAVRVSEKLVEPYQVVTLSEVGPLGIVRSRYGNVEEALTAARNAGIELDERIAR